MQGAADPCEELLRRVERLALGGAQQSLARDAGHPSRDVHVPQTAGAVLQIWLEQVRGDAEALGSSGGVFLQRSREAGNILRGDGADAVGGIPDEGRVTCDRAHVEHRGEGVESLSSDPLALGRRAHRLPDLEPAVPQRVQEPWASTATCSDRSPSCTISRSTSDAGSC